jgi:hypothetical protein
VKTKGELTRELRDMTVSRDQWKELARDSVELVVALEVDRHRRLSGLENLRMHYGEQEQHWANRQLIAELDHILLGHE